MESGGIPLSSQSGGTRVQIFVNRFADMVTNQRLCWCQTRQMGPYPPKKKGFNIIQWCCMMNRSSHPSHVGWFTDHSHQHLRHILFAGADSWMGTPTGRWNSPIDADSWTWAAVKSSPLTWLWLPNHISSKIEVHLLWFVMEFRAGEAAGKPLQPLCKFPLTERSWVGFRCVHSEQPDSSTGR